MKNFALLILLGIDFANATESPRVTKDIEAYDLRVAQLTEDFENMPPDPAHRTWVKAKLKYMFDIDQYARFYSGTPARHSYTQTEREDFGRRFQSARLQVVDERNTADLKQLLQRYRWFTISEFGLDADKHAWLLVQHADRDRAFQKHVLSILGPLAAKRETDPQTYAYLFDRVAVNYADPDNRELQRFGTQGQCSGAGSWEPFPVEDPSRLDERRASVGLMPENEYKKMTAKMCRESSQLTIKKGPVDR